MVNVPLAELVAVLTPGTGGCPVVVCTSWTVAPAMAEPSAALVTVPL
jgi:hypothetical protein